MSDLDNLETPEMILLSAVSGEDAQDRSDRKILMPWVKFLWESYCQCLELLRTNVRVERLYHDIAQQAFRFCLKYQVNCKFLLCIHSMLNVFWQRSIVGNFLHAKHTRCIHTISYKSIILSLVTLPCFLYFFIFLLLFFL